MGWLKQHSDGIWLAHANCADRGPGALLSLATQRSVAAYCGASCQGREEPRDISRVDAPSGENHICRTI